MNWLGKIVAARIRETDYILDLGCGIMPATGPLTEHHVGVDCYQPYLDRVGEPCVLATLPDGAGQFGDRHYDVVLMLDVIEHLDKPAAMRLIAHAERIASREVILFTPDGFCPQDGFNSWGLGVNPAQAHRCGFTYEELTQMGYACERYPNSTEQQGEIMSVLGIKCV